MTTKPKAQRLAPLGINFEPSKHVPPKGYSAGVSFTTQGGDGGLDTSGYVPPYGYNAGIIFSAQRYTPPHGYAAGLEFGTSKQDEDGKDVYTLSPEGIDWPGVGAHDAKNQHEFIRPSGIDANRLGYPEAFNTIQFMRPAGVQPRDGYGLPEIWNVSEQVWTQSWLSSRFSQPHIWNLDQHINAVGIPPKTAWGKHSIWLYERYLKPSGLDSSRHGTQWASHYLRHVLASRPGDFLGFGRPWAVEDPRYLNPRPIEPINITDRHVVGGLRFIEPVGNEMTEWGTRIIPESQTLHQHGLSMQAFGEVWIRNHKSYIRPQGFRAHADEALRFGYQHLWNLKQIIRQDYDPNDGLNPGPFGQWTAIENRNKEPQVYGWLSDRFGYQFIWNKAAPIKPAGIQAPESEPFYKAGTVTHLNRPLELDGIDSLSISGWSVVTNAADPLKPFGHDSMEIGRDHGIENRSRLYRNVGNMDTMAMGTPFIADAIREITFEQRYSIEPPRIELPTVDLYTRYVEDATAGQGKYGVGFPALSIHWRIITPRWSFHPPAFIGEPALRNLTPELYQRGHNSEEYGNAFIRTQWREIRTDGSRMDLFGRPIIRDRRHWVEFTGALPPPNIMPGPKVVRIGGLPDTQRILPPTIHSDRWLSDQVSSPMVGAQEIYPAELNSLKMGTPIARANSIRVEPGLYEHKFGDAWFSLKNRMVGPAKGIEPITDVGKPSIMPHTIYAVFEAPQQAKDNNPYQGLHYVDHDPRTNRSIKGVGNHSITLYHRRVRAGSVPAIDQTSAGTTRPRVYNAQNFVEPRGIQASRMGMPAMLPHDQEIALYGGQSYMSFGATMLAFPPYTGPQYVSGRGLDSLLVSNPGIEFKDRERNLLGWSSMAMGESRRNDTPYMWQGLRVGPLMPTIPNGFNAERFGDATWVSHRVRDFSVEGFDTLACEYDYTNFAGRMRVWRHTDSMESMLIRPVGFDCSEFSLSDLRNRVHYILPDGNAEQYRKGAPDA